ncbi:SET domain-containing protein [Sistotremastrum niveocremeum HHB9708]|uniref:SET domain-containing protein n=1 Tax=Sistotremastrum niveocremeum HHB9708 TaxID=1314777 RepID=A0A164QSP7_9AGAM|nr:SET domain-containing protein [Sistotremastrum niveocremeum HHB9708]
MDGQWSRLVEWLGRNGMKTGSNDLLVRPQEIADRGRGLVLTQDVEKGTPLFTLPASVLLNYKTLRTAYPYLYNRNGELEDITATQLITLHLFLWRPNADKASMDELFGPYIDVLPSDFEWHPIWQAAIEERRENVPPATRAALEKAVQKFRADWANILTVAERFPQLEALGIDRSDTGRALWAWLNVNTRSVYQQLRPVKSHPDNLSLCPVLDFANHVPDEGDGGNVMTTRSNSLTFHSAKNHGQQAGDEVFLCYGPHGNSKLYVEYGFMTERGAEANVDDIVEKMLDESGNGQVKRRLLKRHGYWGDWALYEWPEIGPSYRLLPALCLISMGEAEWEIAISGNRSFKEAEADAYLAQICGHVIARAEGGVGAGNVGQLWEEEARVAEAVRAKLHSGRSVW